MKKTFDTVKMVREIRDQHYESTKNLPWEEQKQIIKEAASKLKKIHCI